MVKVKGKRSEEMDLSPLHGGDERERVRVNPSKSSSWRR